MVRFQNGVTYQMLQDSVLPDSSLQQNNYTVSPTGNIRNLLNISSTIL